MSLLDRVRLLNCARLMDRVRLLNCARLMDRVRLVEKQYEVSESCEASNLPPLQFFAFRRSNVRGGPTSSFFSLSSLPYLPSSLPSLLFLLLFLLLFPLSFALKSFIFC